MDKPIYLDYAATAPMLPEVLAAMEPYLKEQFYNPSAQYAAARAVKRDMESARAQIAHWFGARPTEIIFTAGGSEANNLAVRGVMQLHPKANMVASSIEHEAVLEPAGQYGVKTAPVGTNGIVDVQQLESLIDERTVLVSVMYANNEIGTIQPIKKIGQLLGQLRQERKNNGNSTPLYFHTDASQAAGYLDLHASRLGADMMTINGSKIGGPKQTGVLFVRPHVTLAPQIMGGGQERGLRSGTENVAGTVGLAVALELVQSNREAENRRLQMLQRLLIELLNTVIPEANVNGSLKHRLPNNVHITITGQDNERLAIALDELGIMCATGSACNASSEEPSHVLKALGLNDRQIRSSLRFTMGAATQEQDIRRTVQALSACLNS